MNLMDYSLLGNLSPPPLSRLPRVDCDSYSVIEFAIEVSPGRPVHFILVVDTLRQAVRDGEDIGAVIGLRERVTIARESFLSRSNLKHGITLLVFAGWGRPQFMDLKNLVWENWNLITMPVHDLCSLSDHPESDPFLLWRLLRVEGLVKSLGGRILNVNGVLNLWGWLLDNDWHFAPHEQLPKEITEASLQIIIPTESIAHVRMRAAKSQDRRIIQDEQGRTRSLRKYKGNPYFREDFDLSLYVSLYDLFSGELVAVYLGRSTAWWCSCDGPDRQSIFSVWDVAINWLNRIDKALETVTKSKQIEWRLVVFHEDGKVEAGREVQSYRKGSDTIITEIRFFDGGIFSGPDNQGETELIRSFLIAMLPHAEEPTIQQLLKIVIPGRHAKHMHLVENETFTDMISKFLNAPVFPHKAEDSTLRLGLGWTTQTSQGRFTAIQGKESCREHLEQLVTKVWSELRISLKKYSKLELCERLTNNLESLRKEKVQWERTIHALFDLYSDRANVMDVSGRVRGKINGGNLASRLLIEMAICTCPVKGVALFDDFDISQLMAQALLLFHLGSCSDAIAADLYPPTIHVSAFGQIMLDYSFESTIFEPYQALLNRKQREVEARRAARTGEINQPFTIEPEFSIAWLDEFALPLDILRQIMDTLEDWAAEKGQPSFTILTSSLIEDLSSKVPVPNRTGLQHFIVKLTLPARSSWDEEIPSDGMLSKDWYPWIFRRRLSLLTRPFIALDSNEDPLLLISPGTVRESIAHLWVSSLNCILDERHFTSKSMKKWIGDHRNEVGTKFNETVCERMKALGWEADHDLPLTHLLDRSWERNYGDVDVLAWSVDLNLIVAIECKDLIFAKTHKEIGNQINDFLGRLDKKGKRDRLLKHFDRLELLEAHLPFLAKKILNTSNATMYGLVVFSQTNLIETATRIPHQRILFTSVDKLAEPNELLARLIPWESPQTL
ncbi:MAG: hypothetical protein K8S54_03665 [Spirochaetia bacterium]|nr:hypothetical protein [Spirochaetia bacterium]